MKKVLCLGAGLVARPYIQYLSDNGFHVFVASRPKAKAEQLIEGCENAEVIAFNIATDDALFDELTAKVDLVCSLSVPAKLTFHCNNFLCGHWNFNYGVNMKDTG